MTTMLADVGSRTNRVDQAVQTAQDAIISLKSSLSSVEDVDVASASIDLQTQQLAYQAALATTAKVMQPSLLDFLQ